MKKLQKNKMPWYVCIAEILKELPDQIIANRKRKE